MAKKKNQSNMLMILIAVIVLALIGWGVYRWYNKDEEAEELEEIGDGLESAANSVSDKLRSIPLAQSIAGELRDIAHDIKRSRTLRGVENRVRHAQALLSQLDAEEGIQVVTDYLNKVADRIQEESALIHKESFRYGGRRRRRRRVGRSRPFSRYWNWPGYWPYYYWYPNNWIWA